MNRGNNLRVFKFDTWKYRNIKQNKFAIDTGSTWKMNSGSH